MRLLSFSTGEGASFGAVKDRGVVDLGSRLGEGRTTLRALLQAGERAMHEAEALVTKSDPDLALEDIHYLPTVPDPEKIICIGVNYGDRNAE